MLKTIWRFVHTEFTMSISAWECKISVLSQNTISSLSNAMRMHIIKEKQEHYPTSHACVQRSFVKHTKNTIIANFDNKEQQNP